MGLVCVIVNDFLGENYQGISMFNNECKNFKYII